MKSKSCVEIGTTVDETTNVVPIYDSLPYCDRGEYVKMGFSECWANPPGFYQGHTTKT